VTTAPDAAGPPELTGRSLGVATLARAGYGAALCCVPGWILRGQRLPPRLSARARGDRISPEGPMSQARLRRRRLCEGERGPQPVSWW
jgi:hypothetical protein